MIQANEFVISIILLLFSVALIIFYSFQYKRNLSYLSPISQTKKIKQNNLKPIYLTLLEIKKHNQPNNCWIIINNNVYNVTNYLNLHPGGAGVIIPFCGQDATQAFLTQGGKGSHSSTAVQELQQLYLGPVNGRTSQKTVNQTTNLNISSFPLYEDD